LAELGILAEDSSVEMSRAVENVTSGTASTQRKTKAEPKPLSSR
jgi:hypothetical protein